MFHVVPLFEPLFKPKYKDKTWTISTDFVSSNYILSYISTRNLAKMQLNFNFNFLQRVQFLT